MGANRTLKIERKTIARKKIRVNNTSFAFFLFSSHFSSLFFVRQSADTKASTGTPFGVIKVTKASTGTLPPPPFGVINVTQSIKFSFGFSVV